MIDLDGLPGAPRVERGRRDLARGRWTADAWWLAAARTRLRELGVDLPPEIEPPRPAELALYEALAVEGKDPYFRYNALRAELASFLSALEARVERENRKLLEPLDRADSGGPTPEEAELRRRHRRHQRRTVEGSS